MSHCVYRAQACVREGQTSLQAGEHHVIAVLEIVRLGDRFLEIGTDQPHGL